MQATSGLLTAGRTWLSACEHRAAARKESYCKLDIPILAQFAVRWPRSGEFNGPFFNAISTC